MKSGSRAPRYWYDVHIESMKVTISAKTRGAACRKAARLVRVQLKSVSETGEFKNATAVMKGAQ